jgi:aryl-alcohol dehydrogenase-like predicted oxidoreductase
MMERVVEAQVLALCEVLGIGFVPWGPLARRFLTGRFNEGSTFRTDRSPLEGGDGHARGQRSQC